MDQDPKQLASEHLTSVLLEHRSSLTNLLRYRGYDRETAEDAVQAVSERFFTDLLRFDTTDLSPDFFSWDIAGRWNVGYLRTSALNAAARASRRPTYELPAEIEEALNVAEPEPEPENYVERVTRSQQRIAVRICLTALVDRGSRMKRGTFISPDQWRSYSALLAAVRANDEPVTLVAAANTGTSAELVAQHRKRIENTLLTTRYVVGVLGGPGYLIDPERIHRTLDFFDKSTPKSGRDPLLTAAPSVQTKEPHGTRVIAPPYAGNVTSLHGYESDFVAAIHAVAANCVLTCGVHTVDPERVTEF